MASLVRVNESLRQELLALAEQDQSFLGSPEHDWNSDQVQRQLLDLMSRRDGWSRSSTPTVGLARAWSARTERRRPGRWPSTPCPTPTCFVAA